MNKQWHHLRSLVFVTLLSFLGLLTQPPVATFQHDHHGGEHPHTHTELFVFFAALFAHSHHYDDHEVLHAHGVPHTHPSTRPHAASQGTPTYVHPDSLAPGHWHTFIALHLTRFVTAPQQFSLRLIQSIALDKWLPLYTSSPLGFQPRAPPLAL